MGAEYAKVLNALKVDFITIGRSEKSAKAFTETTGHSVMTGGLDKYIDELQSPQYAIVTTTIEELAGTTIGLIEKGIKNILVEKPAGMNRSEIEKVAKVAKRHDAFIQVAYNRRFYASTLAAEKIISDDGGVTSFNFEFTEWAHQIETLDKPKNILDIWFLANSTHVIDLAFHLGGRPIEMSSYTSGSLDWYKPASIFAGTGISDKGALFSYQANWKSPGRWGVEMLTSKHKLILRPMEQLHMQKIGSVAIERVEIDDKFDIEFKPGLYMQVKSFLNGINDRNIIDIHGQLQNLVYYEYIEQGANSNAGCLTLTQ